MNAVDEPADERGGWREVVELERRWTAVLDGGVGCEGAEKRNLKNCEEETVKDSKNTDLTLSYSPKEW